MLCLGGRGIQCKTYTITCTSVFHLCNWSPEASSPGFVHTSVGRVSRVCRGKFNWLLCHVKCKKKKSACTLLKMRPQGNRIVFFDHGVPAPVIMLRAEMRGRAIQNGSPVPLTRAVRFGCGRLWMRQSMGLPHQERMACNGA